jgi:enoyl-CoA hydratase/carnithine racemase
MGFETIIFQKQNKVAQITFNRPEALNALNKTMVRPLKTPKRTPM